MSIINSKRLINSGIAILVSEITQVVPYIVS